MQLLFHFKTIYRIKCNANELCARSLEINKEINQTSTSNERYERKKNGWSLDASDVVVDDDAECLLLLWVAVVGYFFPVFVCVLFCYCHFCWCWYCSCFCCINSCSCRLFYIFDIDDAVVNAVAIIGGYGAWTMIITKQFMSSAGLCCHFLWWMHIIYFLSNRYLLGFCVCVCVYAFKYTWRMLELSKSVTHPMLIIAAFAYYVVHCQSLMF